MNNHIISTWQQVKLRKILLKYADIAIRKTFSEIGDAETQKRRYASGSFPIGLDVTLDPDYLKEQLKVRFSKKQLDLFCSSFKTWEMKINTDANFPEITLSFRRNTIEQGGEAKQL